MEKYYFLIGEVRNAFLYMNWVEESSFLFTDSKYSYVEDLSQLENSFESEVYEIQGSKY